MPPVSKRKRLQQASLAYAKQTRWTSPECDKENVDPARVSTRSATVKRVSKRDATRVVLKERVGQLEAELKRQEDDLADARKAADTSVARASAAELQAATAERKARRWRSHVSALPPNTQSLFPSRVRFHSVLAHRDQLKKENRALKMRLSRVPCSKERAISKAVARVASSQRTMRLKSKGRVVEPVRMASRDCTVIDAVWQELAERSPSIRFLHLWPGIVKTPGLVNLTGQPLLLKLLFKAGELLAGQHIEEYAQVPFYLVANPEGQKLVGTEAKATQWNEKPKRISEAPALKTPGTREAIWNFMSGKLPQ